MSHQHTDAGQLHRLRQFDRVLERMHREMVRWLNITPGSNVLDAGCGGGGMTLLLAEAVGDGGQVTALDIDPMLLESAKELLGGAAFSEYVRYQQGSIDDLPFPDGSFNLVWCSRVIHHMPDMLAAVREIRRVLKPGGRFALREDSYLMQLLPFDTGMGQPGLDERLNAVRAWDFARVRPSIPDAVPYPFGWTQLLRDAGLADVTARSFLFEAVPPFDDDLASFVVRHWRRPLEQDETRERLSREDQQTLEQLVDPDSPHFLLKRSDLYFVKVSSIYAGINQTNL